MRSLLRILDLRAALPEELPAGTQLVASQQVRDERHVVGVSVDAYAWPMRTGRWTAFQLPDMQQALLIRSHTQPTVNTRRLCGPPTHWPDSFREVACARSWQAQRMWR
jgi:hypothetical protein